MKKKLTLTRETIRSEQPNTWRNSPTEPTTVNFVRPGLTLPSDIAVRAGIHAGSEPTSKP